MGWEVNPAAGCANCGCSTPNPNACKTNCIRVNGPDLSGLTATLLGTLNGQPWSMNVPLDSNGLACYTPTSAPYPVINQARVTGPYCSYTTPLGNPFNPPFNNVNGVCTATFYYCLRQARVAYTANPALSITVDGLTMSQTSDTGSVRTYTACYLSTTNPGAAYFNPATVTVSSNTHGGASGNQVWPGVCATAVIPCGGVADYDVTQQEFSADYFRNDNCDTGCDKGKGPCGRGLIPKRIQIKFESLKKPLGQLLFADDEGQWIDLFGSVVSSSAGQPVSITFDSGNRGPQGNRMSVDGVNLDTSSPQYPVLPFASTRVFFRYHQSAQVTHDYQRLPRFGTTVVGSECSGQPTANCFYSRGTDNRPCAPCITYGPGTNMLCAGRVDRTVIVRESDGTALYQYSLRELGCGSGKATATPSGTQPAGSSSPRVAMLAAERPPEPPAPVPNLYVLAELCPMGSGPCGCGAEPRLCGHPDRALEVWRADCLRCQAEMTGWPAAKVDE